MFGNVIADAVVALTRKKDESYDQFIRRAKKNEIARSVKIADITHNSDLTRLHEVTESNMDQHDKYAKALEYLKSNRMSLVDEIVDAISDYCNE